MLASYFPCHFRGRKEYFATKVLSGSLTFSLFKVEWSERERERERERTRDRDRDRRRKKRRDTAQGIQWTLKFHLLQYPWCNATTGLLAMYIHLCKIASVKSSVHCVSLSGIIITIKGFSHSITTTLFSSFPFLPLSLSSPSFPSLSFPLSPFSLTLFHRSGCRERIITCQWASQSLSMNDLLLAWSPHKQPLLITLVSLEKWPQCISTYTTLALTLAALVFTLNSEIHFLPYTHLFSAISCKFATETLVTLTTCLGLLPQIYTDAWKERERERERERQVIHIETCIQPSAFAWKSRVLEGSKSMLRLKNPLDCTQ